MATLSHGNSFRKPGPFVRGIYQSRVDSSHEKPVLQAFDDFFVVSLNKLLNSRDAGIRDTMTCMWCYYNATGGRYMCTGLRQSTTRVVSSRRVGFHVRSLNQKHRPDERLLVLWGAQAVSMTSVEWLPSTSPVMVIGNTDLSASVTEFRWFNTSQMSFSPWIYAKRTDDAMITSLLRQNHTATSLWCNNDVIIASRAHWGMEALTEWSTFCR